MSSDTDEGKNSHAALGKKVQAKRTVISKALKQEHVWNVRSQESGTTRTKVEGVIGDEDAEIAGDQTRRSTR